MFGHFNKLYLPGPSELAAWCLGSEVFLSGASRSFVACGFRRQQTALLICGGPPAAAVKLEFPESERIGGFRQIY